LEPQGRIHFSSVSPTQNPGIVEKGPIWLAGLIALSISSVAVDPVGIVVYPGCWAKEAANTARQSPGIVVGVVIVVSNSPEFPGTKYRDRYTGIFSILEPDESDTISGTAAKR
jgi:hypothetical protein